MGKSYEPPMILPLAERVLTEGDLFYDGKSLATITRAIDDGFYFDEGEGRVQGFYFYSVNHKRDANDSRKESSVASGLIMRSTGSGHSRRLVVVAASDELMKELRR